jgi:hypothetical protein
MNHHMSDDEYGFKGLHILLRLILAKMDKIKFLLIAAFCVALVHSGLCTPGDSLVIKLTIKSKEIKKIGDLNVTLTIKSQLQQSLYLPRGDPWGLPSSIDGFYINQIQKKVGGNYGNLDIRGNLDNIPPLNNDILHYGDQKEITFPMYILCQYTKGEYRVRVLCKFSRRNNLQDRYSEWAYFTCNSDIPVQ